MTISFRSRTVIFCDNNISKLAAVRREKGRSNSFGKSYSCRSLAPYNSSKNKINDFSLEELWNNSGRALEDVFIYRLSLAVGETKINGVGCTVLSILLYVRMRHAARGLALTV